MMLPQNCQTHQLKKVAYSDRHRPREYLGKWAVLHGVKSMIFCDAPHREVHILVQDIGCQIAYTTNYLPGSMTTTKGPPSGETRTQRLATWAANLQYSDLPPEVVQKTKDFFLDTLGCTIAGRHHPAVTAITRFIAHMGPSHGKCELIDGDLKFTTSPAFASLVNGASSHVVEQDDLHNSSIMHPVSSDESLAPMAYVNLNRPLSSIPLPLQ